MTAKDLALILMELPEDMEVRVGEYEFGEYRDISSVDIKTSYVYDNNGNEYYQDHENSKYDGKLQCRVTIPCNHTKEIVVLENL